MVVWLCVRGFCRGRGGVVAQSLSLVASPPLARSSIVHDADDDDEVADGWLHR